MSYYQQGDVLIKKVAHTIGEFKKVSSYVLAEGEVTGHCHTLLGNNFSVLEKDGKVFVKINETSEVIHQEHSNINILPGEYEIQKVREYDHFLEESRNIKD